MKRRIFTITTTALLLAALAISCFASSFVISIEEKDLPKIVGELANEQKEIVAPIPEGDLIIVPLSESDTTEHKDAKENLEDSYKELKGAEKLSDICPELDGMANEIVNGASSKDLSVTDIFYVNYVGKLPESVNENGYVVLTIDLSKYDSKYDHLFMVRDNNGKWRALTKDLVTYGKDGTKAFLKISGLGDTVAILQMNDNVIVKEPEHDSPKTGLISNTSIPYYVAAAAVVVAAAAIVVAVVSKKKKYQ